MRAKLREKRKLFGYTQKQLSEMTGIERTKYTRIENGMQGVTVEDAFIIAKVLCSNVEDLFFAGNVLNNTEKLPLG